MDEQSLAKLLLAVSASDPERWQRAEGILVPGPDCPTVPRIRTAVLREDWTTAEERHKAGCAYCRRTEAQVTACAWHPTVEQLFCQVRRWPVREAADLAYHLESDRCRHCQRLAELLSADPLLSRLAGRGKTPGARLERVLRTGFAARDPALAGRLTFDDPNLSVTLTGGQRSEFHLERPAASADRLVYLVFGNGQGAARRHLLLPRPAPAAGGQTARLRMDTPPGRVPLVLFELDAEALSGAEAPLVRDALRQCERYDPAALDGWRDWAGRAVRLPKLDPPVRALLDEIARSGPSVRER